MILWPTVPPASFLVAANAEKKTVGAGVRFLILVTHSGLFETSDLSLSGYSVWTSRRERVEMETNEELVRRIVKCLSPVKSD